MSEQKDFEKFMELVQSLQEQYETVHDNIEKIQSDFEDGIVFKQIQKKLNSDPRKYLSGIYGEMAKSDTQTKVLEDKIMDLQNEINSQNDNFCSREMFSMMEDSLFTLKKEVQSLTRALPTKQQMIDIEKTKADAQVLRQDIHEIQQELENKSNSTDFASLSDSLSSYSKKSDLKECLMQIAQLPTKKETDELTSEMVKLQTQVTQLQGNSVSKEVWAVLKESTQKQLDDRPTKSKLQQMLHEFEGQIKDVEETIEKNNYYAEKQLRAVNNEIQKMQKTQENMQNDAENKLTQEDYMRLNKKFERFAPYEDLKELYGKVLPPIASFQEKIEEFQIDNTKLNEIVAELDVKLSQKASRNSVENLKIYAEESYAKKEEQRQFRQQVDADSQELKIQVQKSIRNIDSIGQQMGQKISVEIRNATAQFKKSAFEANNKDAEIQQQLDIKASKSELKNLHAAKASKTDQEMAFRQIEILHKQIQQLSLLVSTKLKQSVDKTGIEQKHQVQNRKVNLLHQSLLISQWIQNFDSANINDCFDSGQMQLPPQLQKLQKEVTDDLKKVGNMELSPNNTYLNESLKNIVQPQIITKTHKFGKNQGISKLQNFRKSVIGRSVTTAQHEKNEPVSILSPRAKVLLSNAYSQNESINSFDSSRKKHMVFMNQTMESFVTSRNSPNPQRVNTITIDDMNLSPALKTTRMPIKNDDIKKGVLASTHLPGIYNK